MDPHLPIDHDSGNVIDFPVIDDLPSLLWVINLGCIDLNQWYARCDDVDRPDYVHFDLDPGPGADLEAGARVPLIVREALETLEMPPLVKTDRLARLHVYVPIVRGPTQKEVWTFAKALAVELAAQHPKLMTAEYKVAKRPHGRVLVDYNQNAWGRTLASIYSVRPRPQAPVSTPVTWKEIEQGMRDRGLPPRQRPHADRQGRRSLEAAAATRGRVNLERYLDVVKAHTGKRKRMNGPPLPIRPAGRVSRRSASSCRSSGCAKVITRDKYFVRTIATCWRPAGRVPQVTMQVFQNRTPALAAPMRRSRS